MMMIMSLFDDGSGSAHEFESIMNEAGMMTIEIEILAASCITSSVDLRSLLTA